MHHHGRLDELDMPQFSGSNDDRPWEFDRRLCNRQKWLILEIRRSQREVLDPHPQREQTERDLSAPNDPEVAFKPVQCPTHANARKPPPQQPDAHQQTHRNGRNNRGVPQPDAGPVSSCVSEHYE